MMFATIFWEVPVTKVAVLYMGFRFMTGLPKKKMDKYLLADSSAQRAENHSGNHKRSSGDEKWENGRENFRERYACAIVGWAAPATKKMKKHEENSSPAPLAR